MKRLILTLLVSIAGFAAMVSYDAPIAYADNTAESQEIRDAFE